MSLHVSTAYALRSVGSHLVQSYHSYSGVQPVDSGHFLLLVSEWFYFFVCFVGMTHSAHHVALLLHRAFPFERDRICFPPIRDIL